MLIYETIYGDWIFLEIRRILEHAETDLIICVLWAEQFAKGFWKKWI